MKPLDLVLSRLDNPKRRGANWQARCPGHDDSDPSLSIGEGRDGRVLLKCWAGCTAEKIVAALGLRLVDLFVEHDHNWRVGTPAPAPKPKAAPAPNPVWAERAERYLHDLTPARLEWLAGRLGVSEESLTAIRVGWVDARELTAIGNKSPESCYTFPEYCGCGSVIGVALRNLDDSKKSIYGSHRGLTIPANLDQLPGDVLVVEGQSDVAACISRGIPAVGRPSNCSGAEYLAALLVHRTCIIMGERDQKPNGAWPGRDGAMQIADKLALMWSRPVRMALPPAPHKDVRAWLTAESEACHA